MTTIALQRETAGYWEQLKDASDQVKLALISLLSSSLAESTATKAEAQDEKPAISRKDLELTPFVASIGKSLAPLPADFDYRKAKEEYLIQKYG